MQGLTVQVCIVDEIATGRRKICQSHWSVKYRSRSRCVVSGYVKETHCERFDGSSIYS